MGSVVVPYILSSTLRRMSTVSTASSGLSSGSSNSSDGPTPYQEALRASVLDDKRLGWRNRKDWSVSKSQVQLERQDADEVCTNQRPGFSCRGGAWSSPACVCLCVCSR